MLIDLVFEFVTHAPGCAILVAILVIQFAHDRFSRKA